MICDDLELAFILANARDSRLGGRRGGGMADAEDLKSSGGNLRVGSIPTAGIGLTTIPGEPFAQKIAKRSPDGAQGQVS
jgi:hypothetical protein